MKRSMLLLFMIVCTLSVWAQKRKITNEVVNVTLQGTDSSVMINTIDLIGVWKNVSSTSQILSKPIPGSTIEITNGHRFEVRDAWMEDYPNKMTNCTWVIFDHKLQVHSPDLGRLNIEIEKLPNSNWYELVLNSVTYRKLINVSTAGL
jgi:hypothetical protein